MKTILCDAALPWQLGFQDGATPIQEAIVSLHDSIMFYLIVLGVLVFWMLSSTILSFGNNRLTHLHSSHGTVIELIWTITPALILLAIALPSFRLLYLLDEVVLPGITIKVVGHQWYWSYEYSDYITSEGEAVEYDSYLVPESDLELGELRLLTVDEPVVLPVDTTVRFIVTATDVIHDFAMPSMGLKIDAMPGRLNQGSALAQRIGTFYGQCSELCGVMHGFMPIQIDVVSQDNFLRWLASRG